MTRTTPTGAPAVLCLVAYQCGPGMGSVSQIGWEWYQRMAAKVAADTELTQLVLYTSVRNRSALSLAQAPLPATEVVYIDTEWFAAPLYKLMTRLFGSSEHAIFMFTSLDFFLFDYLVCRQVKRANYQHGLTHVVTPVSALLPTRLAQAGLPLIIGPLNSGLPEQKNYPDIMRADFQWLYRLKSLAKIPQWLFGSLRRATLIYVAMSHVRAWIPRAAQAQTRTLIENGVDLSVFRAVPWPLRTSAGAELRLIFVGRLVPVKALGLLLQAQAELQAEGHALHLDVVGEGGMRSAWEAQVQSLGLSAQVTFHGNKPLPEVAALIAQAHILCLPSVRESGGAVILEAAAVGRPAIVVDFGGPADLVSADTGAVVSAAGPEQTIAGFKQALRSALSEDALWAAKGQLARAQVEANYSWSAKIDTAFSDYKNIL